MPSGHDSRRGPWSTEEDESLKDLVSKHGNNNWVKIANDIGTRSAKQCRERWHQNLKPGLNLSPITPEEGEAIEKMVRDQGQKWASIARQLGQRSDNMVKNWWNGGQNRRKRKEQTRLAQQPADRRPHQHSLVQQQPLPSAAPQLQSNYQSRPTSTYDYQPSAQGSYQSQAPYSQYAPQQRYPGPEYSQQGYYQSQQPPPYHHQQHHPIQQQGGYQQPYQQPLLPSSTEPAPNYRHHEPTPSLTSGSDHSPASNGISPHPAPGALSYDQATGSYAASSYDQPRVASSHGGSYDGSPWSQQRYHQSSYGESDVKASGPAPVQSLFPYSHGSNAQQNGMRPQYNVRNGGAPPTPSRESGRPVHDSNAYRRSAHENQLAPIKIGAPIAKIMN